MKAIVAMFFVLAIQSPAVFSCTKPVAPTLPDVSTAVTAQMVKSKNEVKAFMAQANAYLECTAEAAEHNQMVDEMQAVADDFNQLVRDYKARLKKG